jgi:hypothetical protein|tara:strand:+ start:200 stop:433 length:234 start_codon:yes stop_codon:yes gene_type:complete
MGSKSFSLDVSDVAVLFKNALLVAVAAFLTTVMNSIGTLDLGAYTPLIVPMVTVVLDTLIKWTKDNSSVEPPAPDTE